MKILIGWDSQDITPNKPVNLEGQYYQRVSTGVRDPLAVTALAMEQSDGTKTEQAVMVSGDILFVPRDYLEEVRKLVSARVPDLDPKAILINATHIHSGPAWRSLRNWWNPAPNTLTQEEFRSNLCEKTALAVERAWVTRRVGGVSFAHSHAAVGYCRRTLYPGPVAEMYGETDREDFIGIEAGSDHAVRLLFTWDTDKKLTGVVVNVPCPSQVMEAQYVVTADYFGEVRARIQKKYGTNVRVLAQVSAAGDQAPRDLPAQKNDPVNYWNESGVTAIGQRVAQAVDNGLETASENTNWEPVLGHRVTDISLPVRQASEAEYDVASAEVERLTKGFSDLETARRKLFAEFVEDTHRGEKTKKWGPFDNKALDFVLLENARAVVTRYETWKEKPTLPVELHTVRVGDCAFVTNPFELYLDFGQMIQARSAAKETFCIQLACDSCGYLPTERAVAGGGYGSLIINGNVGPEGGRQLVETSLSNIKQLWNGK